MTFCVIGTGIVGTSLAALLVKQGLLCVGVHTRSLESQRSFHNYLTAEFRSLEELAREAKLLFITTQDRYIEDVACRLASLPEKREGQYWIHCSRSLPSSVLAQGRKGSVHCLSIHPLQAFANIDSALALIPGTHFGVEGDGPEAEKKGWELVELLGGIPHKIAPQNKELYHAGAVVASNYFVALVAMAVELFEQAGIPKDEALDALLPLVYGSYQNMLKTGLPGALTGPIVRGDVSVVENHLKHIPPSLKETYRGLGRIAMNLGQEKRQSLEVPYEPEIWEGLYRLLYEKEKG